jgi:cytoskeletal protein RodZ
MYRASLLLKNSRLEKQLEFDEISKVVKIPVKHLRAIESEDISCFPQEPYCSLIVKDYADFLGLNGPEILRLFHRDFAQKHKSKILSPRHLGFTPQLTFSLAIIFSILAFSAYLIFEYIKFNQAPRLAVNWPASLSIGSSLDLSGFTDPESTVKINGNLIIVNPDGSFTKKINLTKGENSITIESQSLNGKTTTTKKILKAIY